MNGPKHVSGPDQPESLGRQRSGSQHSGSQHSGGQPNACSDSRSGLDDSSTWKGVLLAGGDGTRLAPLTVAVSKQLMPIHDKPMIFYPLSTLMLAGIRDVLLICKPEQRTLFQRLLGDGSAYGIRIDYAVQPVADGIAQSLLIASDFVAGHRCCLILGDNLFYGDGLVGHLQSAMQRCRGASVFAYRVQDPARYGVVRFDESGNAVSLSEKPDRPESDFAVPGIYFYDDRVSELAGQLQPSPRDELEITDLNRRYLQMGNLAVEPIGRGTAWLDMGTHDSLREAGSFVATIEHRTGLKIACLEEIAFRQGWIDAAKLRSQADRFASSQYGQYLRRIADDGILRTS
ncbi:glucose-1-phosphate thymidylyltransferase RfbA [Crateriforma spongiae]|uniref:glucose-1-phosphate thymidylyltransferase RfbA n=1 Tax=Crateriforma spongiae TaxID=2724528 RepID=UPI001445926B|nr:glucose-1-phosphate thymidylyltransferase RfbA [Crateriforma spongiae]